MSEINHDDLIAHAKKLNEECKTWSSRKLYTTYAQPEVVERAKRREAKERFAARIAKMKGVDGFLREYMQTDEFRALIAKDQEFNTPVTLTYALERLAIVHVKLWMLEDEVRNDQLTDEQIGVLKRKIDYLNGVQRPRLLAGLGEIFAKAVKEGNENLVREPNMKDYKARD